MTRLGIAALVLLLTSPALVACGGDEEQPAADCINATAYGPNIAEGASGAAITPGDAQAVQSEASDLYYVAMNFTVEGDEEPMTGVWLTTTLEPDEAGSIVSVDAFAKEFTQWPDAEKAHDISYPNESTDAAESCLD